MNNDKIWPAICLLIIIIACYGGLIVFAHYLVHSDFMFAPVSVDNLDNQALDNPSSLE